MASQPNALRSSELPEFPITGPFGGIQSEMPPEFVENSGFVDANNVIFRKGVFAPRPQLDLDTVPQIPFQAPTVVGTEPNVTTIDESINGVLDFFNSAESRVGAVITPTRVLQYLGGGWNTLEGALTGGQNDLFTSAVVAHKVLFSQGVDPVQLWDGVSDTFAPAAAAAVPAKYLMELNSQLIACHTIEAGTLAHQRVRWTAPGDATDWTSFLAGAVDLFNDLGPITGCKKLYQQGYIWQQWGIVQMQPTGSGLNPFRFIPMSAHSKGNIAPASLACFGEDIAVYVGKDNIYVFNGSSSEPIGDSPIDGSRFRAGARRRIFADLQSADLTTIFGIVTTSLQGEDFNAYWLFIPNASTWVYSFDDQVWTRFSWGTLSPQTVGVFNTATIARIQDLVGAIYAQSWNPGSMTNNNPLDTIIIGFDDGTVGTVNFSEGTEQDWSVLTGPMAFADRRHRKTVKKMRLIFHDIAPATLTISLTNEDGQTESQNLVLGTGSGNTKSKILGFNIPGFFLTLKVSGPAGELIAISEVTPIYSPGGEERG